jgi:hypothetical protein
MFQSRDLNIESHALSNSERVQLLRALEDRHSPFYPFTILEHEVRILVRKGDLFSVSVIPPPPALVHGTSSWDGMPGTETLWREI